MRTRPPRPSTEGHYLQIEVAGKLASSRQPELADRFLAFLGSEAVQSVIPTTNWMYPAVTPAAGLPEGFETVDRAGKVAADVAIRGRDDPCGGTGRMARRAVALTLAGGAVAAALCLLTLGTLAAVLLRGGGAGLGPADWAALRFTVSQAALSSALSVGLAIVVARALARRRFRGAVRAHLADGGAFSAAGDRGGAWGCWRSSDDRASSIRDLRSSERRRCRSTGCMASCWRMCSSICRWRSG